MDLNLVLAIKVLARNDVAVLVVCALKHSVSGHGGNPGIFDLDKAQIKPRLPAKGSK
jgi:hypothetical protein